MPTIDDSWVVTTDCVVAVPVLGTFLTYAESRLFACSITAIAGDRRDDLRTLIPELLRHDTGHLAPGGPEASRRRLADFEPWPVAVTAWAGYLDVLSTGGSNRGRRQSDAILSTGVFVPVLLNDLRVPVAGSPPARWQSLGEALGTTRAPGGARIALTTQADGITAIATGLDPTLLIRMTYPAPGRGGDSLAEAVRRRFGAPEPDHSSAGPLLADLDALEEVEQVTP